VVTIRTKSTGVLPTKGLLHAPRRSELAGARVRLFQSNAESDDWRLTDLKGGRRGTQRRVRWGGRVGGVPRRSPTAVGRCGGPGAGRVCDAPWPRSPGIPPGTHFGTRPRRAGRLDFRDALRLGSHHSSPPRASLAMAGESARTMTVDMLSAALGVKITASTLQTETRPTHLREIREDWRVKGWGKGVLNCLRPGYRRCTGSLVSPVVARIVRARAL